MEWDKKQYNDSPQVLVSRQTDYFIERDNFSAMYFLSIYSWNYKLFWNFFCFKKEENDAQLTKK